MKKNRYLEYKDSRYEWLGEIPSHWELKRAKWGFQEKSIKGYPKETLLSVSKGKGVIPRDELEKRTVMAFKDLENFKLVVPNDFVIHLRSFQSGFEMSTNQGIVSPAYTVFSCKGDLAPKYYKFLFYTQSFIDAIASTTQSLRDGKPIAYKDFSDMELPYPSYSEQIKIADFLEVKLAGLDNLIDMKEKLILLLNSQRQSIITEAVTKGLNPNVKMKDSGVKWIGAIPEHWDATKIVYYAKLLTGGTPDKDNPLYWENGNINWMASGEVNKEFIYEVNSKITELGMNNSAAKLLPKKSVMMAMNGQGKTKGKVAVLEVETTCNQSLAAFVCKEEKLHYLYLYYYLKSKYKELRGLVGDGLRDGISLGLLKSIKIPLPSVNEQQEIAKYLFEYDTRVSNVISKEEDAIKLLKESRLALIYEVVTGKIDVRDMVLD